jgi:hypothetical protein
MRLFQIICCHLRLVYFILRIAKIKILFLKSDPLKILILKIFIIILKIINITILKT